VQEDRPDFEGLFVVAVAALDDLLAFVVAQDLPGGQPLAGEVGRQRVDPVGLAGGSDRIVITLEGERGLAVAGAAAPVLIPAEESCAGLAEDLRAALALAGERTGSVSVGAATSHAPALAEVVLARAEARIQQPVPA
jgi:hypothetical protein